MLMPMICQRRKKWYRKRMGNICGVISLKIWENILESISGGISLRWEHGEFLCQFNEGKIYGSEAVKVAVCTGSLMNACFLSETRSKVIRWECDSRRCWRFEEIVILSSRRSEWTSEPWYDCHVALRVHFKFSTHECKIEVSHMQMQGYSKKWAYSQI